jgi:predicted DCC family thiol-disulfide oxidoreductase YuxK
MENIVFFDGSCGFCNRSVALVLRHEKNESLHFASLQSEFCENYFTLKQEPLPNLNSFILFKNKKFYYKSTASLRLVHELKWYWHILKIGWIVPRVFRDAMYDFVAQNRHRISKSYCVVPSLSQKKRFLTD